MWLYILVGEVFTTRYWSIISKKGFPETKVSSFMDLGIDPDAKEACLFALLANETVAGSPDNLKGIKDSPAACMGKISFPY